MQHPTPVLTRERTSATSRALDRLARTHAATTGVAVEPSPGSDRAQPMDRDRGELSPAQHFLAFLKHFGRLIRCLAQVV